MTQEEIIQGNKLIADFMGYPECGLKNKDPYYYAMKHAYKNGNMRYHTSWDWLMPVWVKFRDVTFSDSSVSALHTNYIARLAQVLAYETIDMFYFRLIPAIQWHNTQTKQHGTKI
jgi:hypothetical protein